MKDQKKIFSNPNTLRVFLYLRQRIEEDVGIRELQRELGYSSPSTSSWHLNKLEEVGLTLKLNSNKYVLTEKGKNLSTVDLPINIGHYLIRGRLIPSYSLFLVFHGILLVVLGYAWIIGRDLVKIAVTGSLGILISFILVLYFWLHAKISGRSQLLNTDVKN